MAPFYNKAATGKWRKPRTDACFQERNVRAQPQGRSTRRSRQKLTSLWRHRSSPQSRENAGAYAC